MIPAGYIYIYVCVCVCVCVGTINPKHFKELVQEKFNWNQTF
jgi:hypothetical protein